jgi:hypothetical protein
LHTYETGGILAVTALNHLSKFRGKKKGKNMTTGVGMISALKLVYVLFKNLVFASHKTHYVSTINTNQLLLFREFITV